MFLQSLATAVPNASFTQPECWDMLRNSRFADDLQPRSMAILRKVLTGDNGIERRQFVTSDIERVFDQDVDALNATFHREAPRLATRALRDALDAAGLRAGDLDALLVCTCTGYLCPGLTSYIAENLNMRTDAFLQDLVGLGCGAAIPTLRAAEHIVAAHPEARVATVAVEICSAAFYLDDDPGVLISACLFSDGAAAAIWNGRPHADRLSLRAGAFQTRHLPADRELLRFETRQGKLRNKLAKTVPEKAAAAVAALFAEAGPDSIGNVLAHPGGRDVLLAVGERLPGHALAESRRVLRRHGNMSSPSVLFALKEHLETAAPNGDLWLVAFGAGFSCHACRLESVHSRLSACFR